MRNAACLLASGLLLLATACGGETRTETQTVRETVTQPASVSPQPGLPRAVAEKREAILHAADYEALAGLVDPDEFEYTFGEPVAGGPSAYWRQLEEGTDERPLQILHAILQMPYTREREVYVWPFAFNKDLSTLTPAERQLLLTILTERQIRQMQEFGGYIGWRAGIRPDGGWIFFIAGD
jgi:hypothetical protein